MMWWINFGIKLAIIIVIAIVLAFGMRYLVYKFTGWKEFKVSKGENFQLLNEN